MFCIHLTVYLSIEVTSEAVETENPKKVSPVEEVLKSKGF